MAVTTKTFPQVVQGIAAAIQARASGLVDVSVGAITRATAEGFSGVVMWLQGLILAVLIASRASTSVGADLDSWIADWGSGPTAQDPNLISRFQAVGASGLVTFSRLTTSGQVVVPVGATVTTQDGSQQYVVGLDTTNPAYRAPLAGYVLTVGLASVTCLVQAVTPGAASNAVAGAINTINSSIPGVDSVTNAAGFVNGLDEEGDSAFLSRFRLFMASLREATPKALAFAITNLQQGVACKVVELFQHDGTARRSFFYYVVDDGSGSPPTSLINAAGSVIDAHRAAGMEFGVYAPQVVAAAVSMTVVSTSTSTHSNVVALVVAAVANFLNTLPLGQTVYYSRLWQVAHDASPDVVEITNLTLQGASVDLVITQNQVAKAGTLTVV